MKDNFEITSVEDGKKYWISRSVATSAFIFKVKDGQLYVLTEIRGSNMHDFPGMRCVPCGYVNWDETVEDACIREVYEETGLKIDKRELIFEGINSDPSTNRQNISIHYSIPLTDDELLSISDERGGEINEVAKLEWVNVDNLPNDFCFNHDKFITQYSCTANLFFGLDFESLDVETMF
jgi:8-oxo-dGTP diphosphatase